MKTKYEHCAVYLGDKIYEGSVEISDSENKGFGPGVKEVIVNLGEGVEVVVLGGSSTNALYRMFAGHNSKLQNDVELTQENTYDQPPHPSMIYSINDLKKIEKKLSEGVKQSVINILNANNQ